VITVDAEGINTKLPKGYHARPFRDSDREPLVEERNRWSHPMEQQSAEEWRMWERMAPDETQYRIVVEDDAGRVVGSANVGAGSMMRHPDGAQNGGVSVARADRRHGIGSALLAEIESIARSRGAPRFLSGASAAHPDAVAWASNRGYREIGRRIEAYVELATFDPAHFADRVSKVRSSGIAMRTFAEAMAGRDDEERESFYRELFEAQGPMWEDVPFATRLEPISYERFRKMSFESGQALYDLFAHRVRRRRDRRLHPEWQAAGQRCVHMDDRDGARISRPWYRDRAQGRGALTGEGQGSTGDAHDER
jgi:GNAT superfamily N-acetyltransferase